MQEYSPKHLVFEVKVYTDCEATRDVIYRKQLIAPIKAAEHMQAFFKVLILYDLVVLSKSIFKNPKLLNYQVVAGSFYELHNNNNKSAILL